MLVRVARSLFLHVCLGGAVSVGVGVGLALWSAGHAAAITARQHALDLASVIATALPWETVDSALDSRTDAIEQLATTTRRLTARARAVRSVVFLSAAAGDTPATARVLVGAAFTLPRALLDALAARALTERQAIWAPTDTEVDMAAVPVITPRGATLGVVVVGYDSADGSAPPLSYWPLALGLFLAAAAASAVRHRFGRALAVIETATTGTGGVESAVTADTLALGVARLAQRARLAEDELEHRVRARTRELADQNRLQEEQVANTVHELRTPLTTILASLSILHDGVAETEEERRQFLDNAMTATRHMTFLCNDILDTAAFEAGKLRIDIAPCDVQDLLAEADSIMRPLAISRDVTLRVEEAPPELMMSGDRSRILQVLFNLVGNAVKYSRTGGQVTLRAQQAGNSMAFEVEDDGIGVPVAARGKLFTKYSRVHDKDSSVPGTGIGLYLCRILVEQMGGSIGFDEREAGTGSVFWFTLPLSRKSRTPPVGPGVLATS